MRALRNLGLSPPSVTRTASVPVLVAPDAPLLREPPPSLAHMPPSSSAAATPSQPSPQQRPLAPISFPHLAGAVARDAEDARFRSVPLPLPPSPSRQRRRLLSTKSAVPPAKPPPPPSLVPTSSGTDRAASATQSLAATVAQAPSCHTRAPPTAPNLVVPPPPASPPQPLPPPPTPPARPSVASESPFASLSLIALRPGRGAYPGATSAATQQPEVATEVGVLPAVAPAAVMSGSPETHRASARVTHAMECLRAQDSAPAGSGVGSFDDGAPNLGAPLLRSTATPMPSSIFSGTADTAVDTTLTALAAGAQPQPPGLPEHHASGANRPADSTPPHVPLRKGGDEPQASTTKATEPVATLPATVGGNQLSVDSNDMITVPLEKFESAAVHMTAAGGPVTFLRDSEHEDAPLALRSVIDSDAPTTAALLKRKTAARQAKRCETDRRAASEVAIVEPEVCESNLEQHQRQPGPQLRNQQVRAEHQKQELAEELPQTQGAADGARSSPVASGMMETPPSLVPLVVVAEADTGPLTERRSAAQLAQVAEVMARLATRERDLIEREGLR